MTKTYAIVFLLVATELIGFGLIIPVLPQISAQYTSSDFLIGCLLASYSIAQFFAAPLLGQLSDRIGRKPVLILSKLGTALSYVLLSQATTVSMLIVSRLLDGFTGGNIGVARAYLSDITDEKNQSKAMAIIGISFAMGFIIGPGIGAFCYGISSDFSIAGWIGAGLSIFSMILTVFGISEPKKKQSFVKRESLFISMKKLNQLVLMALLSYGCIMLVFSGFETSFSIYTFQRFALTESDNSLLFFYVGIASFFIQGSLTKVSFKPFKKAVTIAFLSMSLGFFLTTIIDHMIVSLCSLFFVIFGLGVANTHIPAQLTKLTVGKSGFILGVYESVGSIARMCGPIMVYFLFFDYLLFVYTIFSVILLLCWIAFMIGYQERPTIDIS